MVVQMMDRIGSGESPNFRPILYYLKKDGGKTVKQCLAGDRRIEAAKEAYSRLETPREDQWVTASRMSRPKSRFDEIGSMAIDNLHAESVNPVDEGRHYAEMAAAYDKDFGEGGKGAVALHIGYSRAYVSQRVTVYEKLLNGEIREAVIRGDIDHSQAYIIASKVDQDDQDTFTTELLAAGQRTVEAIKAQVARLPMLKQAQSIANTLLPEPTDLTQGPASQQLQAAAPSSQADIPTVQELTAPQEPSSLNMIKFQVSAKVSAACQGLRLARIEAENAGVDWSVFRSQVIKVIGDDVPVASTQGDSNE
jgi:hypothetical protein